MAVCELGGVEPGAASSKVLARRGSAITVGWVPGLGASETSIAGSYARVVPYWGLLWGSFLYGTLSLNICLALRQTCHKAPMNTAEN